MSGRRLRCLALAAALTTACGGGSERSEVGPELGPFPDAPVILISIDTLRSDRLPAYGYDAGSTPNLDALRRDAVLFERAYSNYPLTVPSHASILTGQLPPEHGVRDNIGYPLQESTAYLPHQLREAGWATGGAVSTWLLRGDAGFGHGFDFYEDSLDLKPGVGLGESQRPGAVTVDRAIEWLEGRQGRYFLFVHLYEPHTPWAAPEPYRSRHPDPYDAEIAHADSLVGRLLAALRDRGDYDRALVIVLSDHGEGLGDHGEQEHGILLYREALQVPLLVKLPGNRRAGEAVAPPVQLTDVAPTVRRLLGIEETPALTLFDLAGSPATSRPLYAETWYPRLHLGWSELTSVIDGDLHYIEGPDPELYDLAADPSETRNVVRERRRELAELRDSVAGFRRELAPPAAVDEETTRRLASLGYLASSSAVPEGDLPDPKSQMPQLEKLNRSLRLAQEKRWPEAVEALQAVLQENPRMADGWQSLAQALQQLGRFAEAEEAYRQAMEITGGTDHVALGLARLFLDADRLEDARQHAELALATNPVQAHQVLAQIAFEAEDTDLAEKHARAVLVSREDHVPSLLLLARAALERDLPDEAMRWVGRAHEIQRHRAGDEAVPGLWYVRGDVLARLGRVAEAERAFREEIQRYPAEPRAYTRLALLYALEGRSQEAVAVLRQLVEGNENPPAYAAAVETLRVLGDPAAAERLLSVARSRFPGDPRLQQLSS